MYTKGMKKLDGISGHKKPYTSLDYINLMVVNTVGKNSRLVRKKWRLRVR